jgi:hypothetical protein
MPKNKIKPLLVEMPAEMHAALMKKAKSEDLRAAQVVRKLIAEYLQKQSKGKAA